MKSPQKNNRMMRGLDAAARAVGGAVKYDLVALKVRTYVTESEQKAAAALLAIFVLGLVKKYLI